MIKHCNNHWKKRGGDCNNATARITTTNYITVKRERSKKKKTKEKEMKAGGLWKNE